jgi:hypothetical protein
MGYAFSNKPVLEQINAYLRRIDEACDIKTSHGTILEKAPLFTNNNLRESQIVRLIFPKLRLGGPKNALGFRLRIRFDIHREYFSFTQIADLFDLGSTHNFKDSKRIQSILNTLNHCDLSNAREDAGYIYEGFWTALEVTTEIGIKEISAERFGEFRGFVVSTGEITSGASLESRWVEVSENPAEGQRRLAPDLQLMLSTRVNLLREILFGGDISTKKFASRAADVVLCGLLDGRALYASSLGQGGPSAHLKYFIAYDGKYTEQLGRLVRRLHVLGEMRLAALLDYGELSHTSRQIRNIGRNIDRIARVLPKALVPTRDSRALTSLTKRLQSLLTHQSLKLTRVGKDGAGWLVYRTSHSKYYAEAYKDRLRDLRVVRIEGWQPYDEFVRRYLFQFFGDISRIGERYESLSRRLARYVELAQTQQIRLNGESMRKLLSIGDLVGTVAVTYYGGTIFAEIWHSLLAKSPVHNTGGVSIDEFIKPGAFVVAFFTFLLLRFVLKPWFESLLETYEQRQESDKLRKDSPKHDQQRPLTPEWE